MWGGVEFCGPAWPAYILKAKKFAEPPFQSKKLRKRFATNAQKSQNVHLHTYILKAKKFAEPPFQSKKLQTIFGPFWVILGPF